MIIRDGKCVKVYSVKMRIIFAFYIELLCKNSWLDLSELDLSELDDSHRQPQRLVPQKHSLCI